MLIYRVDVTNRPTFYCTVVEEGDDDEWDALYERYKEDSGFDHLPFDEVEKHNLLFGLSCSENVYACGVDAFIRFNKNDYRVAWHGHVFRFAQAALFD